SGSMTYDLTGQPDGTYTVSVVATDLAGNASPAATSTYVLDTTPPVAPTITAAPVTPGNGRSAPWSLTGESCAPDSSSLIRGAVAVFGPATCTSPTSYDLTGQPDGTYTFTVTATDAAGNTSAAASSDYLLDTTPPAAPVIGTAPATPSNQLTPAWTFTTDAGTTTTCSVTRVGIIVADPTPCSGSASYDLTGQPDGTYTLTVIATDAAGNDSVAASGDYELDTTPPAAPVIVTAPATPSNSLSVEWEFTTDAGTTTTCSLTRDGKVVVPAAPCTSPMTYDLTGKPDGTYTFTVTATDAAGNVSAPATSDYVLRTSRPAPPTITMAPPAATNNLMGAWSFTTLPGTQATCTVTRDGVPVAGP